MITASHNPWEDNGLKIIRPDGEMLHIQDEKRLEDFVNQTDLLQALDLLEINS